MDVAKSSLEIKRKVLEGFTENGLYPYSKRYLRHIREATGKYWKNHFSTIGIVGVNEAVLNLLGQNIATKEGQAFAVKTLTFMRKRITEYQEETGDIYNLEATPAEGTAYRLARIDQKRYRDIIFANQKHVKTEHAEPFYTNSSQLPVDFAGDLFDALGAPRITTDTLHRRHQLPHFLRRTPAIMEVSSRTSQESRLEHNPAILHRNTHLQHLPQSRLH